MRKLVATTFVTLDGVIQAPGGPEEDRDGGFAHGGWSVNYWNDAMMREIEESIGRMDALLLGRRTYEIFAAHWPRVSDDDPIAAKFNRAPKYVVSTTLERPEWRGTTVLRGGDGLAGEVERLKRESGSEILVQGSSRLLHALIERDLLDEYRLWTFPVTVGAGKRLFDRGTPPRGLRLTTSHATDTGVVVAHYERTGALEVGSFALDADAGKTAVNRS